MTRQFPAALTILGALSVAQPITASAQGVTITGTTNAGVQLTKTGDSSLGFGLNGGFNGSITSQTRAYTARLSGGVGFTLNRSDFDPRINLNASFAGDPSKRTRASIGASFAHQPIDFELVDTDLSLISQSGTRTTSGLNASLSHELDARTLATLSASYSHVDFDPVTVETVPSDNYRLNGSLRYELNRRTTLTANGGIGWFTSENLISTESFSVNGRVGLNHELDSLTTVNASAGLSFVNTEETVGSLRVADWSTALLFDAGISRAYSDGTMTLSLSQEVAPTAAGELAVNTGLNASLSYDLNRTTSLGLNVGIARQGDVGGGNSSSVINIAPSYSMELAEGLDATARYNLQFGEDSTNHRLSLGISREIQSSN